MKRQLTSNQKKALARNVLFILTPLPTSSQSSRKIQSAIRLTKSQVGDMLRDSIDKLSVRTDQIFPLINLDMQTLYGDNPEIAESIKDKRVQSPNECRACVYIIEISDNSSPSLRKRLGISHLVAVQVAKKEKGWNSLGGVSSVKVETTLEKLPYLIHDIALDIAMFHSWPFLSDQYNKSTEEGIEFSKMKARFAQKIGLNSYYGPIIDTQIEYFSFAAFCREGPYFNYEEYERIWKDFLENEILDGSRHMLNIPEGALNPLQYIFKFHIYSGQLSRDKLSKAINNLGNGTYLLLLTHRKPHRKKVRSHIAMLFSQSKFRLGYWKIVPFGDYEKYARQFPYITFFKFMVTK